MRDSVTHLSNATLVEDVPPRLESDTSFTNNLSVDYFEYEIDDDFRILVQSLEDSTQQSLRFDHLRLESNIRGGKEGEDEEDKEGTNVGFREDVGGSRRSKSSFEQSSSNL